MLFNSFLMGLRGQAEIIALRHQLTVLKRTYKTKLVLNRGDRCLWVWLSRVRSGWRSALVIVKPDTVIGLRSCIPLRLAPLTAETCNQAHDSSQSMSWTGFGTIFAGNHAQQRAVSVCGRKQSGGGPSYTLREGGEEKIAENRHWMLSRIHV